jgi:hypothetical protein
MPTGAVDKLPLLDENDNTKLTNETEPELVTNGNSTKDEKVLASYQEFFNYNVKAINTTDTKYTDLVNKAKSSNKIIIEIEASASKVPTRTFKTNKNLAENRAEEAKRVILKSLLTSGVNESNITFKKPKSLVQGPNYKGDFENESVYEKYQYVIIRLK